MKRFEIDQLEERIAPAAAVAPPVTPATAIHGLPGNNAGFGEQAYGAAPTGSGPGDGGIHGINNVPGQGGADPGDGDPGFRDQLDTVHGGILNNTGENAPPENSNPNA